MSLANRLCRGLRYNIRFFLENPNMREFGLLNRRRILDVKEVCKKYPDRLRQLLDELPATLEIQIEYSWNPRDCSPNLIVRENGLKVARTHTTNCTDGIRGKIAVSEGLHVWELFWPLWKRGSNASIGVGTSSTPLFYDEYVNLVGHTADSWGWDIVHCKALHDFSHEYDDRTYPSFDDENYFYRVPSTIFIVLDMDAGTLSFIADGEYLGVAFDGLRGQTLFPIIGCVWGCSEISLKYIGSMKQEVPSLKEICRRFVGKNKKKKEIERSKIPEELKTYTLYNNPDSTYNTRVLHPVVEDYSLD